MPRALNCLPPAWDDPASPRRAFRSRHRPSRRSPEHSGRNLRLCQSAALLRAGIDRLHPSEVPITINGASYKTLADRITTSKRRLHRLLGTLGQEDLKAVCGEVRLQLGL